VPTGLFTVKLCLAASLFLVCVIALGCSSHSPRWTLPAKHSLALPTILLKNEIVAIVPMPRHMVRQPGALLLGNSITIGARGNAALAASKVLASAFARLGADAQVTDDGSPATIRLSDRASAPELGGEGYRLSVTASGIDITANSGAGLFYGVQTLEQLASDDGVRLRPIPLVRIVDWPEYRWRGLHLDVSRHFFSVQVVEKYIDVAARFKLNIFHWHLTDDQGWRIEIPGYPRLTSIGACRDATQTGGFDSTTTDETPTCAFYNADDVRHVVAYAKARYVEVVPEIEGPGHSVEALAAYEYLACAPGPYATLVYWGSTKYSVCPTERTFAFYRDVIKALSRLFPAPFIHIGGDEVPYYSWRGDPFVDRLMFKKGLKSYAAVQGYFTRRLEAIARQYGKRIIGWDEIDKAATSQEAIVMAWTGAAAGLAASAHGNDVIMTPNVPLYFDAYQGPAVGEPTAIGGLTTLHNVYDYDPMNSIIEPAQRAHILGAQGNLWSEYLPTPRELWYMAYPRSIALAEVCWSPRSRMDWDDFQQRLATVLWRLEALDVNFRIPEVRFELAHPRVATLGTGLNYTRATVPAGVHSLLLTFRRPVTNAEIRYTVNGTTPTAYSRVYKHPFILTVDRPLRVIAVASLKGYRSSAPSTLTLTPE
jgi:hexosaminidase